MTNEQRKTLKKARQFFPDAKIIHIFPNAYCIAKTAGCCAVLVTPPTDREKLVRDKPGVLVQNESAALAEVGQWYELVYVARRHSGEPFILPNSQLS